MRFLFEMVVGFVFLKYLRNFDLPTQPPAERVDVASEV